MAKRALLIGSATGGLNGCGVDIGRMTEILGPGGQGFEILPRTGRDATRDGILDAYRALIDATGPDDAALVYYSGHGARVVNSGADSAGGGPAYYQAIVPFDFEKTTASDFRGITSIELSALLSQLTRKTEDVTVILDCCHSAAMSRSVRACQPRARKDPLVVSIEAHLKELRDRGISLERTGLEGNPLAVRLVACGLLESAWEYQCEDGQVGGILTESLAKAVAERGAGVATWEDVGRWIRNRVLSVFPTQRPDVEGPLRRRLFSKTERPQDGRLGVVVRSGVPHVQGGTLLDVRQGDVYEIRGMGEAGAVLGRGVVETVGTAESRLRVDPAGALIPEGAEGVLVQRSAPRVPIAVSGEGAARASVEAAVAAHPLAKVAAAGETPIASLSIEDGKLAFRDYSGDLLAQPRPLAAAMGDIQGNLSSIARAHSMRKLEGLTGAPFGDDAFSVTWGLVEDGKEKELRLSGEALRSGDSMFVRIVNKCGRRLHVSVFDVGVSQKVDLLTESLPSGVPIEPGGTYTLGTDEFGAVTGCEMFWPESVPDESARHPGVPGREESFVVIVMDSPQDLRVLEAGAVRGADKATRPGGMSELEAEFGQLFHGGTREIRAKAPRVGYRVAHIQFFLRP